jgi:inner membrane protein
MATIFAHALVPLAARAGLGSARISKQLMGTALLATMIPDLDVISFLLGIPYGDAFGHRGFTHSILFAGLAGLIASFFAHPLNSSKKAAFWLVFISVLSHPVLDAFTNGGLGVAFFWPLSDTRYFMPWRPIMVSPIGVTSFFEARSLRVLTSEFFWVVLPLTAFTVSTRLVHFAIKARKKT